MYDTKIINSICSCKKQLNDFNCEIIMLEPCEHMVHIKCFKHKNQCPLCNTTVTKTIKLDDYKKDSKLAQKCIDILSMTTVENLSNVRHFEVLSNIPSYINIGIGCFNIKTETDIKNVCKSIFSMLNLKMSVKGLDKIKNKDKKVFVANHCGYLDALILYYILNCSFLASSDTKNTWLVKRASEILPLLFVQRGHKQNTVEQMKTFLKHHESICIFPEGMFSHPGTISRFRTGAFQIGEPVYPILLKYNTHVSDTDISNFALKIGSNLNESVEITFLDPVYPPFNENTPEFVRTKIATAGNLLLSRVLGNDIKDKNKSKNT